MMNKNRRGSTAQDAKLLARGGRPRRVHHGNVPQLPRLVQHGEIMGTGRGDGFKCWGKWLSAADYGVPQTRRRADHCRMQVFDHSQVFPATQDAL